MSNSIQKDKEKENDDNNNNASDFSDDEPHRRTIDFVEDLVDDKKSLPPA